MANQYNKEKILFIVEAMGGGVFTYIVDLTNELVKEYDIYLAYAIRMQTPIDYKNYFDERIHLIEVKNFERSINPAKDIKAFFEVRRISKEINPDMIHLHSSKVGAIGRFAFDGKKVPLFYTPHGYSFLMENHSKLKRSLYRAVEMLCGKRNCTTISCSEGEHQETLKLTKRAVYVNNGINTKDLQGLIDDVERKNNQCFTVFTLGRICYQKNPSLFNEIAKAMPNVRFIWIGDGELKDKLTASNIKITGWVERKIALEYSLSADAFLLTSLWEGLPMSLLEAMYMKKICVVSDVIGNHDVIHNDYNGYVCRNVEDFVDAISKVINGDATKFIEIAYNDVLDKYNTTVMAKKYSEIYKLRGF